MSTPTENNSSELSEAPDHADGLAAVVDQRTRKKDLPTWVSVIVILGCILIAYAVYAQLTADKPTILKNKKISSSG
jgi:hypothetical protein